MELVKGEEILISINGQIISCWRSSTLQVNADVIGISTIGSGNWKEYEGVSLNWTVSGEGQIYRDATFSIHSAYSLMTTLQPVDVVFKIDPATLYFGKAIIISIQEQGNVNDTASFNISMQGTGKLNSTATFRITGVLIHALPSTEVEITFEYDAVPGASSYTIEVTDITDSTTTTDTGGASPRTISGLDATHDYSFRLKSNPDGSYGDPIIWP
jgi:predicted secreted protein